MAEKIRGFLGKCIEDCFGRVGQKIKALTIGSYILEVIASIIVGIVFMFSEEGDGFILIGLLVSVCGPIITLFISWFVYGYGQLIDKIEDIELNTRTTSAPQPSAEKASEKSEPKTVRDFSKVTFVPKEETFVASNNQGYSLEGIEKLHVSKRDEEVLKCDRCKKIIKNYPCKFCGYNKSW